MSGLLSIFKFYSISKRLKVELKFNFFTRFSANRFDTSGFSLSDCYSESEFLTGIHSNQALLKISSHLF